MGKSTYSVNVAKWINGRNISSLLVFVKINFETKQVFSQEKLFLCHHSLRFVIFVLVIGAFVAIMLNSQILVLAVLWAFQCIADFVSQEYMLLVFSKKWKLLFHPFFQEECGVTAGWFIFLCATCMVKGSLAQSRQQFYLWERSSLQCLIMR